MIKSDATVKQNKPDKATVVNLGVSFLHLKVTEKIEKPIDEVIPNTKPIKEDFSVFPKAIITIPIVANTIAIQTFKLILSLKNKKPSNAVKKGITAKHNKVTAAVVKLIEYIKPKNAVVKHKAPIIVVLSIFKIFSKKEIPSFIKR